GPYQRGGIMSHSLEFLAGRVAMAAELCQGPADMRHALGEGFIAYLEKHREAGFVAGDMSRAVENFQLLQVQSTTVDYLREVHDRAVRHFIRAARRNERKGRP
ncbi:MAG: hypothetical protein JWP29_3086, partial [Rhodoferax sp.]|nr:hypothetical protein [Rhodoferax sp.]